MSALVQLRKLCFSGNMEFWRIKYGRVLYATKGERINKSLNCNISFLLFIRLVFLIELLFVYGEYQNIVFLFYFTTKSHHQKV